MAQKLRSHEVRANILLRVKLKKDKRMKGWTGIHMVNFNLYGSTALLLIPSGSLGIPQSTEAFYWHLLPRLEYHRGYVIYDETSMGVCLTPISQFLLAVNTLLMTLHLG